MEDAIRINVGTLSSFNNFRYNVTSAFVFLNDEYSNAHKKYEIIWDLRFVEAKKMKLNVLTAFLSVAKLVRNYLGHPAEIQIRWDPYIYKFWRSIDFIDVAMKNDLFVWNEKMLGGALKHDEFSPFNKITSFDGIPETQFVDTLSLENWKGQKRYEISGKLLNVFGNIINNKLFSLKENERLRHVLSDTCSELIVNCLLHGKEISFVGMQRTSSGLSICISDCGIGFLNGLLNNQVWAKKIGLKKSADAILNASLLKIGEYDNLEEINHLEIKKSRHIGLLSAINDILKKGGYVLIHSQNAEIRWELPLWNECLNKFSKHLYTEKLQTVTEVIGPHPAYPISKDVYFQGYYRIFETDLKGSIISFEIPNFINPLRNHASL